MPSKNQKKAKKAAAASSSPSSPPTMATPENFEKVITDMCADLTTTFPEYAHLWTKWTMESLQSMEPEARTQEVRQLFEYCVSVYPERFFDILYKNMDMFQPDSAIPTFFLPSVEFKTLFRCEGVSENTCNVMWNYLQLVLFNVLGSVDNKSMFGESKNLFDGIDEGDLMKKLSETMQNMTSFFQGMHGPPGNEGEEGESDDEGEGDEDKDSEEGKDSEKKSKSTESKSTESDRQDIPFSGFPKMPNLDELHSHLKGLFDGKIGALAKELAEEISGDFTSLLGEDGKDIRSTQDMIQKLMKNPGKITELIKTIGDKLKKKMSSGEVSQEELMKEATDLLNKMKGMGGMGGGMDPFKEMFKNMGVPMPKNARMDVNALERLTKHQSTRERLKNRMMQKKTAQAEAMMKMAASMQQGQGQGQSIDLEALSQQLGLNLNETMGVPPPTPSSGGKKSKKK